MRYVVRWNIFAETDNLPKARKIVSRLETAIERPLSDTHFERYWKDRTLTKVDGTTTHEAASPMEAAFAIQAICNKIAPSWIVSGPAAYERIGLEFDATASQGSVRVPGIAFLSLSVLPPAEAESDEKQELLAGFA